MVPNQVVKVGLYDEGLCLEAGEGIGAEFYCPSLFSLMIKTAIPKWQLTDHLFQ